MQEIVLHIYYSLFHRRYHYLHYRRIEIDYKFEKKKENKANNEKQEVVNILQNRFTIS